jgi:acylphosphatase
MLVKVSRIEPNPFRDLEADPLDRTKIEALKISIGTSFFWDNIMAREHPTKKGYFQLAYGHHRITAVSELGIEEIDIPVKPLDDATILIVMANENLPNWQSKPASVISCVMKAKSFIEKELSKYKTWEEFSARDSVRSNSIRHLLKNANSFASQIRQEIGFRTIHRFLGNNYSPHIIQDALSIIKSKKVDIEIVKTLPNMKQAVEFKDAVEKTAETFGIKGQVPKETQEKIAAKMANKSIKSEVEKEVVKASAERNKEETKDLAVTQTKEQKEFTKLEKLMIETSKAMNKINGSIDPMLTKMEELNVDSFNGLGALEFRQEFIMLMDSLKRLAPFFNSKVIFKEKVNE